MHFCWPFGRLRRWHTRLRVASRFPGSDGEGAGLLNKSVVSHTSPLALPALWRPEHQSRVIAELRNLASAVAHNAYGNIGIPWLPAPAFPQAIDPSVELRAVWAQPCWLSLPVWRWICDHRHGRDDGRQHRTRPDPRPTSEPGTGRHMAARAYLREMQGHRGHRPQADGTDMWPCATCRDFTDFMYQWQVCAYTKGCRLKPSAPSPHAGALPRTLTSKSGTAHAPSTIVTNRWETQ